MTLEIDGGYWVVLVNVCHSSLLQCTKYIYANNARTHLSLVMYIRVAPKTWEPRDQPSPGSLLLARSVEKRA